MTGLELVNKLMSEEVSKDVIDLCSAYKELVKELEFSAELIATREPPGDRWRLVGADKVLIIDGIIETMTEYMHANDFKGSYKLDPLDGKLYAFTKKNIIKTEPKKYNLYGEY